METRKTLVGPNDIENPQVGMVRVMAEPSNDSVMWEMENWPRDEDEYNEQGPFMSADCANCRNVLKYRGRHILTHKATGRMRCGTIDPRYPAPGTIPKFTPMSWHDGYVMAEHFPLTFEDWKHSYGDPENYQGVYIAIEEYQTGKCGHEGCTTHMGWVDIDSCGFALWIEDGWIDVEYNNRPTHVDPDEIPETVAWQFGLERYERFDGARPARGGDGARGDAEDARPVEHEWQTGRFTGTMTCQKCGLLPLDEDDMQLSCKDPIEPDEWPQGIDVAMCGTCGRFWDDGIVTSLTPAPAARCPFEYFHDGEEIPDDFPVKELTTETDS